MVFLKSIFLFTRLAVSLVFTLLISGEHRIVSDNPADEFVLVDKGQTSIPVILYKDAPPRTVEAAKELINYIHKISGARPELIVGEPKRIPTKAVWVGFQPAIKPLFKNINFKLRQEEVIIASDINHLIILGNDEWDSNFSNVGIRKKGVQNFQKEYGTVNAVYTFLQDYLGVRWFMPGELGEDYIKSSKIAFKPFIYRYAPPIKARSALFVTMAPGRDAKESVSEIWSQRNRIFFSSLYVDGGHPFSNWWEKYGKKYPEIFALTTQGSRKPLHKHDNVKLCVSNTLIDDLWLKEVDEKLKKNPFEEIFNVNENDGYGSGYCTCANCRKLDVKDMFDKEPNLSDRHIYFANRLALALKKKYPDKTYKVNYFAYGPDRPAPLKAKPSKSIIVTSVANFHLRRKTPFNQGEEKIKEYLNWSGLVDEMIWRPNLGSPVGLQWGMPDIAPNQAFDDFEFIGKRGAIGLYFDQFQEHWATQGPQYYVTAQLAWNPFADKEILLNDYYQRFYGPAAATMRIYWESIEKTRQKHLTGNKMSNYARFSIGETYNEEWFKTSYRLLDDAISKIKHGDKENKFRRRIEFVKEGLKYSQLIVAIRREMTAFEKGDKRAGLKVEELWNQVFKLKESMDPLSINFVYIKHAGKNENKKSPARMLGLESVQPVEGSTLRKMAIENAENE